MTAPTRGLSLVHTVRPAAPGAKGSGRPPLLVLLHGVGANEQQMAQLAPAFDPRFVVVSPRMIGKRRAWPRPRREAKGMSARAVRVQP